MKTLPDLDIFTRAYITCALWSSTDNATEQGGEPLDANYSIDDIAPETLQTMIADCADFQSSFGEHISGREAQAGHDFWLTRNGHGAGFWDGDWSEAMPEHKLWGHPQYRTVGDFLTAMSKPYGSFDLYVGDDGQTHGS